MGQCWRISRTSCTSLSRNAIIFRCNSLCHIELMCHLFKPRGSGFTVSPLFGGFQGFQVFCDLADGFSGLGSKVTELLHDSYSGRGILTWGLAPVSYSNSVSPPTTLIPFVSDHLACRQPPQIDYLTSFFQTPMKDLYHQLNSTLGAVHLASNSSFFCPLTLRGGLGRRPSSPTTFPLLNCDVRASLCLYLL